MKSIVILILVAFVQPSFSQDYLIGSEFGITSDVFENTGKIKTSMRGATNVVFGLNVQKDLTKYFSLETGLRLKYYVASSISYQGDQESVIFHSAPLGNVRSFQLPLRAKFKHNMGDRNVNLIGNIGLLFCTYSHSDAQQILSRSTTFTNEKGETMSIREQNTKSFASIFPLLETGIGLEFNTGNFRFETLLNYSQGFSKLSETNVYYKEPNNSEQSYIQKSNGGFLSLLITLKYKL